MHDGVVLTPFLLLLHLLVVVGASRGDVQQRANGRSIARASLCHCCRHVGSSELVHWRVVLHVCVSLRLCTHDEVRRARRVECRRCSGMVRQEKSRKKKGAPCRRRDERNQAIRFTIFRRNERATQQRYKDFNSTQTF